MPGEGTHAAPAVTYRAVDRAGAAQLSDLARRLSWALRRPLDDAGLSYARHSFCASVLSQELAQTGVWYWIIESRSTPVGYLKCIAPTAGAQAGAASFKNFLYLERLYLLPREVGSGIGAAALQFAESHARRLKLGGVWLRAMATATPSCSFISSAAIVRSVVRNSPCPTSSPKKARLSCLSAPLQGTRRTRAPNG